MSRLLRTRFCFILSPCSWSFGTCRFPSRRCPKYHVLQRRVRFHRNLHDLRPRCQSKSVARCPKIGHTGRGGRDKSGFESALTKPFQSLSPSFRPGGFPRGNFCTFCAKASLLHLAESKTRRPRSQSAKAWHSRPGNCGPGSGK